MNNSAKNIESLNDVLETLQGLKEQANLAMQLLDDNIAVKLEDTELKEIQSKINPKYTKYLDAYLNINTNIKSYVDIDEKAFAEWWTQYEYKEGEDYTQAGNLPPFMSEIGHDTTKYKKDCYVPFGTYYSEYLEIELEMVKQSYPSDAEAMACFYSNIYVQEDGKLNYFLSGVEIEDTNVENITYKMLPMEKRNLSMVNDSDYVVLSKEEFLKELTGNNRRFDSLAYRIEELQSDEELFQWAIEIETQRISKVLYRKLKIIFEDYNITGNKYEEVSDDPYHNKEKDRIEFNTTFYNFQKEEISKYCKVVNKQLSDDCDILIETTDITSHNYISVTICLINLSAYIQKGKTSETMAFNPFNDAHVFKPNYDVLLSEKS